MNQVRNTSTQAPLTVAVTGSAGSGKSSVCRRLVHSSGCLIDADQVARDVVMPGTGGLKKIVDHFGDSILTDTGTLNRPALRRRMVTDAGARKALEAIVHPEIITEMAARMKGALRAGHDLVVVEVPLLFELDMAPRFDRVVLVKAERSAKVKRLMERDHVTREDALRLLDIQMPDEEKEKHSDFIVENNGSLADLIKNVDRILEMLYLLINGKGKIA